MNGLLNLALIVVALRALGAPCFSQEATNAVIQQIEGRVEFSRRGSTVWDPAYTNQVLNPGDQVRTLARARAVVQLADLTLCRVGELSRLRVPGLEQRDRSFGLGQGVFYFFHRGAPGTVPIKTPTISAVVRGTEYVVRVDEAGTTALTVLDGQVEVDWLNARRTLSPGDEVEAGGERISQRKIERPYKLVQWALFYPAVLDLSEIELSRADWAKSAEAYARGAVRLAAELTPEALPQSGSERLFAATLLLAAGKHREAEQLLEFTGANQREESVRQGIRKLIASVTSDLATGEPAVGTATEWLGQAYLWQSRGELEKARDAVERALKINREFALGRAKLAELHFSFGLLARSMEEALAARKMAPQLAGTFNLEGFYLAARNKTGEAIAAFSQAIVLEPAMGEAWLGRGLTRVRRGEATAGRSEIETAVTLDPTRALFRSYLAKVYFQEDRLREAFKDLAIARQLDPADPTSWLYSGLIREKQNDLNRAIRDLDDSQRLNDKRRNFRSRFLLDEDRSVRSANLARVYADAGLEKESLREAVRAVAHDYGNFSAHAFLANSQANLRDPRQTALRYETPWLSEFLVANLLSPPGGTPLSTHLSTHEYTSLLEQDRFGVASTSEYFSRGDWFQAGSQYGRFGSTSYSLDAAYSSLNGLRPNHDFEQRTFSAQAKQQLTLKDSLYLQAVTYDGSGGDLAARQDPGLANRTLRFEEEQRPVALAGYHREWQPGMDSLAVAGFFQDDFTLRDEASSRLAFTRDAAGAIDTAEVTPLSRAYRSRMQLFHSEAQQIVHRLNHTLVAGLRYQAGTMEAENRDAANAASSEVARQFLGSQQQEIDPEIQRFTAYVYDHWEVADRLILIGGFDYSTLKYPSNARFAPLSEESERKSLASPKGGVVWTPFEYTTLRAGYSRSLGGVSFERSFSLEPSQIAGFTQNYRSLHPESLAGANSAEEQEISGVGWDQQLSKRTYAGIALEMLRGSVARSMGGYELGLAPGSFDLVFAPAGLREQLRFRERSVQADIQQLIGRRWSLGMVYRVSEAMLDEELDLLLAPGAMLDGMAPSSASRAVLHQLQWNSVFNHESGIFARAELNWTAQNLNDSSEARDDDFWELNIYAGYRFWERRGEIRVGLLNALGQDYRISPLNFWREPYRDRTFTARLRFVW